MNYKKSDSKKLKDSFDGFQDIEKNYSQAFQDLFTLTMLNGKKNGTYIEIGGSDPINMNNTYLLEKSFGWKGLSFELDSEIAKYYNSVRVNKCFCLDATQADYSKIFEDNQIPNRIDYLQVDIEPSWQTLKALKQLDFDSYRFSVITYETDAYNSNDYLINESREIFSRHGYQLVASNVKNLGNAFEDWYIDPSIVPEDKWKKFQSNGCETNKIMFKSNVSSNIFSIIYSANIFSKNVFSLFKRIIFSPRWKIWKSQLFDFSQKKVTSSWVLSQSRINAYLAACKRAALDDKYFSSFKRDHSYTHVLEHVTFEEGNKYLSAIKIDYLDKIEEIKQNDTLGSPIVYEYPILGSISPTTIRYIKNSSDIVSYFGTDMTTIVEIGGGYGGLSKVLSSFIKYKKYCIIDLYEPNLLSLKYLSHFNIPVTSHLPSDTNLLQIKIDLLISNYAFSECERDTQILYIEKFVKRSDRFYMLYNDFGQNNIHHKELIDLLKNDFEIEFFSEHGIEAQPKIIYGRKIKCL